MPHQASCPLWFPSNFTGLLCACCPTTKSVQGRSREQVTFWNGNPSFTLAVVHLDGVSRNQISKSLKLFLAIPQNYPKWWSREEWEIIQWNSKLKKKIKSCSCELCSPASGLLIIQAMGAERESHITSRMVKHQLGLPNHTGRNKVPVAKTGGTARSAVNMSPWVFEIIITTLPSYPSSVYFKRFTLSLGHTSFPTYLKTITEDLKCIVCHLSRYQFTVIFLRLILSVWGDTFNTIFSILISTKKAIVKLFSSVFLRIQFTV